MAKSSREEPNEETNTLFKGRSASNKLQFLKAFKTASDQGDWGKAQLAALRFVNVALNHDIPTSGRQSSLMKRVQDHEAACDWRGVEVTYGELLAVLEGCPWEQFSVHNNLRKLYVLLDQHELALQEAHLANAMFIHQRPLSLVSTLEAEAWCALRVKSMPEAQRAISEVLLTLEGRPTLALLWSRILIVRARYSLELCELLAAEQDLAEAWNLLEPQYDAFIFAGVHEGLANWWETTARLRAIQGDLEGTSLAWGEAVDRRRHVAQLPQMIGPYTQKDLSDTLCEFGQSLLVIGDLATADEAFRESHTIRRALGLPPGDEPLLDD